MTIVSLRALLLGILVRSMLPAGDPLPAKQNQVQRWTLSLPDEDLLKLEGRYHKERDTLRC